MNVITPVSIDRWGSPLYCVIFLSCCDSCGSSYCYSCNYY